MMLLCAMHNSGIVLRDALDADGTPSLLVVISQFLPHLEDHEVMQIRPFRDAEQGQALSVGGESQPLQRSAAALVGILEMHGNFLKERKLGALAEGTPIHLLQLRELRSGWTRALSRADTFRGIQRLLRRLNTDDWHGQSASRCSPNGRINAGFLVATAPHFCWPQIFHNTFAPRLIVTTNLDAVPNTPNVIVTVTVRCVSGVEGC
mmetsp:Transcript_30501/g.78905  ORF Transcript_30501/g.78905 Transcript_30501/m.78905 type:complete len:206 (+) Transcript_30501:4135-4752(+)